MTANDDSGYYVKSWNYTVACLFKRSNAIYYIAYNDGKRRRRWMSTGFRDYNQALNFFRDNQRHLERPRILTIDDFAKDFDSYAQLNYSVGTCELYRLCFRRLKQIIGNKPLKLITVRDVERFKSERRKFVSPTRVNIEFRTLKAALNKAVSWEYLARNPFLLSSQLRVPPMEPVYLSKDEFNRLVETGSDTDFRDILIFAVSTMMRLGEILNLSWQDIDFQKRLIYIRNKKTFVVKGMRPRIIPMSERIYYLILSKQNRGTLVFTNKDGKPLLARSVSHRFKKYVRKCKLSERIHFHSLRHTGASWLIQEGVPIYEVQRLLGHSSPAVTQIYSHFSDGTLRKAVEKISITPAELRPAVNSIPAVFFQPFA